MSSDSAPVGGRDGTVTEPREGLVPEQPSGEPPHVEADAPLRERLNPVILSLASFCLICFGVWVVFAGKRYREDHDRATQGWRVGSSRSVEVTLVKEDKHTLACASSQVVAGLRCGGERDWHEGGPDPQILQPYNTTGNEIFLGAGLWSCPGLREPLPEGRFTAVCNYHIKGVIRSATIRFGPTGTFTPLGKSTMVGTLTDCIIPR